MDFIPDPKEESSYPIKSDAARITDYGEDSETQVFKISFARYKPKECHIDGMSKENGAHLLKLIRDVGIYFTDRKTFLDKTSECSEIKRIYKDGDYSILYKGLDEDEEIYEMKKQQKKKGVDIRLFFFTIQTEKTFYVLSAQGGTHYDTAKSTYRGNRN